MREAEFGKEVRGVELVEGEESFLGEGDTGEKKEMIVRSVM